MKTKPWYELNIDITNAVRADFNFQDLYNKSEFANKPIGIWNFRNDQIDQLLTQEWIDYTKELDMEVKSAMLFYREPHFIYPEAHVDLFWGDPKPCVSAINWVLDPLDDSEMVWYDVPVESGIFEVTPAKTKYLYWPLSEVEDKVLDTRCIGNKPTLVRTGIAHNVIVRNRPRWVVSARLGNTQPDTWEKTVEHFKPFIVE